MGIETQGLSQSMTTGLKQFWQKKKSGLQAECVAINNEKPSFEIVKAESRLL